MLAEVCGFKPVVGSFSSVFSGLSGEADPPPDQQHLAVTLSLFGGLVIVYNELDSGFIEETRV